jgi:ATP synthase F1 complex assembly factor 2
LQIRETERMRRLFLKEINNIRSQQSLLPFFGMRATSQRAQDAKRSFSELRLDYHYGLEKKDKSSSDSQVRGAKLVGIQAKTHRWYKRATVEQREGAWAPLLDNRPILTPMELPLVVPSKQNALMIAAEWEMQHTLVRPHTMPTTRLATTIVDRLVEGKAELRHALVLELLDYIETDTICFRPADKDSEEALYEKQQAQLRPFLKWFSSYFNMNLMLHFGVVPEPQPPETINGLRLLLHNATDWELGCLDTLVSRTKSLVLGLALWKGPFSVGQCIAASRIEEEHNISEWGECEGAHDLEKLDISKHIAAATAFLRFLPPEQSSLKM